jgi:glycosyltransferase involved in cell wall biosynthesis
VDLTLLTGTTIEVMTMAPLLSVIITAYNEGDFLVEAVRSVQQQTFPNREIILVDDGASGYTKKVIDRLAPEPELTVIRQANQGQSVARNVGIAHARGKYIGLMDGDDVWHQERANILIAVLDQNPDLDLIVSWWRVINEQGEDTGRRGKPYEKMIMPEDLIRCQFLGGPSNFLGRKEAFIAAGLFDSSFRSIEDLEFLFRLAHLRPNNIRVLPRILWDYRVRGGQLTKNWPTMWENWEEAFAKMRSLEPERVEALEPEARAIFTRYLAYLAYESKDYSTARTFLHQALRMKPGFLLDRGSWMVIAAITCTLLPELLHAFLAQSVMGLRKQLTITKERRTVCGTF